LQFFYFPCGVYQREGRFSGMTFRSVCLGLSILFGACIGSQGAEQPLVVQRIAFGSCARQDRPQPIWDAIIATQPDLFIFLGDNIYADTEDMEVMRNKYALLGAQPGYQRLQAVSRILATWDDHDYGANDAGVEYPMKRESQQIFLDFFGEPEDSPRRRREGVYDAKIFGPEGKRVQVILLDTRYFRTPLKRGYPVGEPGEGYRGIYVPDFSNQAVVLGEEQWQWLEGELRKPAELRVIASSIQVIPNEHGWEKWGNFPMERERLFRLIRETQAEGVVLISGDRHFSEMSRLPYDGGYPLFEVTSSSLNAPSGNFTPTGVRWVNELNHHRVGLVYFDVNFGMIQIDWDQASPVLRLQVRDEKGNVMMQQRVELADLRR
jgi:alkaline phosphatase D